MLFHSLLHPSSLSRIVPFVLYLLYIIYTQAESVYRFLNTPDGRDKFCRLVQYFCRFHVYQLEHQGASKDLIDRWNNLKQVIANGRKFIRLFKPLEIGHEALRSLAINDEVLRTTTFVNHVGNGIYCTAELFVLTATIGFYEQTAISKISNLGQKGWLISLLASMFVSLYKLRVLRRQYELLAKVEKVSTEAAAKLKAERELLKQQHSSALYQFIQDGIDIVIPTGSLGYLPTNEGIIGIAGVITSAMAMNSERQNLDQK